MGNQVQGNSRFARNMAWTLSLLLFLLPLLSQAHWSRLGAVTAVTEAPPCHQASEEANAPCPLCKSGSPCHNGDCCELISPLNLILLKIVLIPGDTATEFQLPAQALSPPDPPANNPYRPPIQQPV